MWINARRFTIVARNQAHCYVLAELMHSYNILASRTAVYAPQGDRFVLTHNARIGSAINEDPASGFEFLDTGLYHQAVQGNIPILCKE